MTMNKVLIELHLPAAMEVYDIFVPKQSTIGEVMFLLGQILPELSGGLFEVSAGTILCDRKTGKIFSPSQTTVQAGLTDGAEVYII